MSVGLPGTGIGAAFYLLSALWSPVRSMLRHGDARRRGFGIALLALGIVCAVALATFAIAMLMPGARLQVVSIDMPSENSSTLPLTLLLVLVFSPLGTLALLLTLVRVTAVLVRRSASRAANAIVEVETMASAVLPDVDDRLEVVS